MIAAIALSGFTTRDSAGANAPPAFSADDESAVRSLVNEFANTWNRHDMKAMHELDTEDVEWINVVGHSWRGKATVYKGHVAIHKGMCATTSASVESSTIRSITPTVAIAVATVHFVPPPTLATVVSWGEDKSFLYDGQTRWHLEDCTLPEHGDRP
jgi:uncharacterized protein (TIGR02246 family)